MSSLEAGIEGLLQSDQKGEQAAIDAQPTGLSVMKGGLEMRQIMDAVDTKNQETKELGLLKDAYQSSDPSTEDGQKQIIDTLRSKGASAATVDAQQEKFLKQQKEKTSIAAQHANVDLDTLKLRNEKMSIVADESQKLIDYHDETMATIAKKFKDKTLTMPDPNDPSKEIPATEAYANELVYKTVNAEYKKSRDEQIANGLVDPKTSPEHYDHDKLVTASKYSNLQKQSIELEIKKQEAAAKIANEQRLENQEKLNEKNVNSEIKTREMDARTKQQEERRKAAQGKPYEVMVDGKPHNFINDPVTGQGRDLGEAAPKGAGAGGQGQAASIRATSVMGGMEDVVITANNIKNMPFTTAKIFNLDKANHIISAPEEWLKGSWTTEQSQEYSQHLHGIGNAMGLIENNGTKTSDSQRKAYTDKYEVPAGSSKYTGYMALAQMRQDLEAKVKSMDASSMYNPEQKKEAHRALDEMKDAVPYSVKNLQEMKYKGQSRLGDDTEVEKVTGEKPAPKNPKAAASAPVKIGDKSYTKNEAGEWIESQ